MRDSAFSEPGKGHANEEMITDLSGQYLREAAPPAAEPGWKHHALVTPSPAVLPHVIPAAVDVALLVTTWMVATLVSSRGDIHIESISSRIAFLLIYVAVVVLGCEAQHVYGSGRLPSVSDECVAVWRSMALGTVLLVGIELLAEQGTVEGWLLVGNFVLGGAALAAWRYLHVAVISRASSSSTRHVLVIGAGDVGQSLARTIVRARHLGYSFAGFLDRRADAHPRVLGNFSDFSQVVREHFIDEIFITNSSDRDAARNLALQAAHQRIDVTVVPDLFETGDEPLPVGYIGSVPVIRVHRENRPVLSLFLKRIIDIVGSGMGLLLFSPVFALIAIAIKLDSPGPVFYCATRLGRKGSPFTFYKFRSMVDDADRMKEQLRQLNKRQGPTFKITNDPRITRVGRFLRRSSLDELPQFLNVLKGEMSLVGPRPHPLDDCEQYELEHLRRLEVTPGITGLWQVEGRKDVSFENNLALDIAYIDNWTLGLDIKLLLRTIPAVFSGSGE